MNETLKFPNGLFTHTELAQLNGKTNQQVWVRYQQAIKDGIIVSAGERPNVTGRGKPSRIWKLNGGQPVTVVTVVSDSVVTNIVSPTPAAVVVNNVGPKKKEKKGAKTAPKEAPMSLPSIQPAVAPVVVVATVAEVPEVVVPKDNVIKNPEGRLTDFLCPVCNQKLVAFDYNHGVKLWCSQTIEVCKSSENPFGFSNNDKNAYEVLCSKWSFAMGKNR